MSRVLLVVLVALLLVPFEVEAGKRRFFKQRWPAGEVIVVENKLGPEWNDAVEETVRNWRRVFPRLRYRVVHRPGKCRWREGRIVICRETGAVAWVGFSPYHFKGHTILKAQIRLVPEVGPENLYLLCHEFGHALNLTHHSDPASCLAPYQGQMTPSPFDRESLLLLYDRKGPRWP